MKVKDLIEKLSRFNPEMEVVILDGFNGGGDPRTINFGPYVWDQKELNERKEWNISPDYSDLNVTNGTPIVVMGYGCY